MRDPAPTSDYRVKRSDYVPVGLPFENGDRMDQKSFHKLFETTDEHVKAELIGGIVYVSSPVSPCHGHHQFRIAAWLGQFAAKTPGLIGYDNTSIVLGPSNEVMPDLMLTVAPEFGGSCRVVGNLLHGSPELVVEIAHTSASKDLGAKKADYEDLGVRDYCVVVVKSEIVKWFTRKGNRLVEQRASDGLFCSAALPGLWLDAEGVFAKSPQRLTSALRKGLASPAHAAFVRSLTRAAKERETN